jgi:peptide/nickel transport system substrate-binding protein
MKQRLVVFLLTIACIGNVTAAPETLYIALGDEPSKGFDSTQGWGKYGHALIQSTLLKRNRDFELEGDIAVAWTLSKDKLSWDITLRDDVKFSDGTLLTADDVAFTFIQAKKTLSMHDLSNLDRVKVSSPTSVTLYLNAPDITFIDNLVAVGIVPKHRYDKHYAQQPIGSGPYQFVRWNKGESLTLKRNPYYYGPTPQFESLVIVFGEEHVNLALFKTGQIQLTTLPQKYIHALPSSATLWNVKSVDNRGIVWPVVARTSPFVGTDITSDLVIRKAVSLAINRELIVSKLLQGYAYPAASVSDGLPWEPKHRAQPTFNIAQAKQLLDEAGWTDANGDGIREKNEKKAAFNLYYKSGDSVREELSITISQMVKAIGVHITPIGADWDTIAKHMHADPVLMGFGSHSASEVAFLYHSNFAGVDFYNSGFYNQRKVDTLLNEAKSASSWQQSIPLWQKAQELASLDEPWSWLVNLDHLYATDSCLDLGKPFTEPHAHGWPILSNINEWRWTCH